MQFSEEFSKAPWRIDRYSPGCIFLNQEPYYTPILLHQDFMSVWDVKTFEFFTQENLEFLQTRNPELILIGTGAKPVIPSRELLNAAQILRISLEIMPTAQACRTYNLMANDGRNVLAGLFL